jgi:hypothetical protein
VRPLNTPLKYPELGGLLRGGEHRELVGAKYIELLSTITCIWREAYAVLIAYRGIRSAREKPVAGCQVEKLVRGNATWRVLGKMRRSQKPWRSAEKQRDAREINGVVSTTAVFRLIQTFIPIHTSLHDGGIQIQLLSSLFNADCSSSYIARPSA